MKTPNYDAGTSADETLQRMEAALEQASERSKLAKQAVKAAKAIAKAAKKDTRRARKALAAAREDAEAASAISGKDSATTPSIKTGKDAVDRTNAPIAESPERVRLPRRKREAKSVAARLTASTAPYAVAVNSDLANSELTSVERPEPPPQPQPQPDPAPDSDTVDSVLHGNAAK